MNELCTVSSTSAAAAPETSGLPFVRFQLDGGEYCADKLLFSNVLQIAMI